MHFIRFLTQSWLGISAFTCCTYAILGEEVNPVVGAYFENWSQHRQGVGGRTKFSVNDIDTSRLTDLYIAFGMFGFAPSSYENPVAHLTDDFTVQQGEWNDQTELYPRIQMLKRSSGGKLKTWLSIGGYPFNDPQDPFEIGTRTHWLFSAMVAHPEHRKQFIESAIDYAHQYAFDGIAIDWEFPGILERGGSSDDFGNLVIFLKECSQAFHQADPPLLLTLTTPGRLPFGSPRAFQEDPNLYFQWLAGCAEHVDRLNVMGYDYHGTFDYPRVTGVNCPLFRDTNPDSGLSIDKTLRNYIQNGVPAKKIVLGLPTYGPSYGEVSGLTDDDHGPGKQFAMPGMPGPGTSAPGLLSYFEIQDMLEKKELILGEDAITNTAYAYSLENCHWVSFDTPDTIALKVQLAKLYGVAGVYLWAIDMDEYYKGQKHPLLDSAYRMLHGDVKLRCGPDEISNIFGDHQSIFDKYFTRGYVPICSVPRKPYEAPIKSEKKEMLSRVAGIASKAVSPAAATAGRRTVKSAATRKAEQVASPIKRGGEEQNETEVRKVSRSAISPPLTGTPQIPRKGKKTGVAEGEEQVVESVTKKAKTTASKSVEAPLLVDGKFSAGLSQDIQKEYNKLVGKVAGYSLDDRTKKNINFTGGYISVSDLIAYQIGWGKRVIEWYDVGVVQRKKPVMPGDGFTEFKYAEMAKHFYATYGYDRGNQQMQEFHRVVLRLLEIVETENKTGNLDKEGVWEWAQLKSGKDWPLAKWVKVNTAAPYSRAHKLL